MKLEGKTAVITGGARGLGKGFAEHILENGGKVTCGILNFSPCTGIFPQVALLDVRVGVGQDTANDFNKKYGQGSAIFVQCNVSDKDDFASECKSL